jgi:hypothetical protein
MCSYSWRLREALTASLLTQAMMVATERPGAELRCPNRMGKQLGQIWSSKSTRSCSTSTRSCSTRSGLRSSAGLGGNGCRTSLVNPSAFACNAERRFRPYSSLHVLRVLLQEQIKIKLTRRLAISGQNRCRLAAMLRTMVDDMHNRLPNLRPMLRLITITRV